MDDTGAVRRSPLSRAESRICTCSNERSGSEAGEPASRASTGHRSASGPHLGPEPTIGEIYQLVLDSSGIDTDGDGVPDDVEMDARVGTDPNLADTDGDPCRHPAR